MASPLHGIWRIIPSPGCTEILAQSGFDFQILDAEHGGYDFQTLLTDTIACEANRCAPWIRVSGTDKVEVQRCLDLGARGIVFPQLASYEDFAAAAAMMDHAPAGVRGFNPFVRAYGYGTPGAPSPRPWCVPIIETLAAVEQLDRILQLERIYINGGSRGFLVELAPDGLIAALHPIPVQVGLADQEQVVRVGLAAERDVPQELIFRK